ncbi:MAG: AraC family transcriptional regulator [Chitinophagaceae bacterium]
MKPSFEAVHARENTSFLVRKFEEKRFSAPYHFHPEYELTLILNGKGKRYVGAHMNDFFSGDFVLLGANLPHCWKTDDAAATACSSSVVIQFQKDFLGKDFFLRPEMKSILQLLDKSSNGLQFTGNTALLRQQVTAVLNEKNAFKKLSLFLDLLYELSTSPFNVLDKKNSYSELSVNEKERMNAVMAYMVDNFRAGISLTAASSAASMTPQAFCKYFKKITRKTFIEAVTDYRIDFAIRQLINSDKSIAQIGFDSGFNDISNFHKTFKARLKLSPLGYRNTFIKKLG